MRPFPKGTIRQQLRAVLALAVGIALLAALAAVGSYQTFAYRRDMVRDLGVRAALVEASSTAALVFEDRAEAEAALSPLENQEDILAAFLFSEQGAVLASYRKRGAVAAIELPQNAASGQLSFRAGHLLMVRPILLHGRRLGYLSLTADLSGLRRQLAWGAAAILGIGALAFAAAYGLSQAPLKALATPMAELAAAARAVAGRHDYGIRVRPGGSDELGRLMDDFNAMLAQVEQRDQELLAHRERLEELVRARTAQMERDMEEKKALEKQFLRAQRLESLGTLAGGVAHDLNNVLTPILLSIQSLKETMDEPGTAKVLSIIEGSALRGSGIVKQILAFARGLDGERAPLDLATLLEEVAAIVGRTFPKDIRLELQVEPKLPTVLGDATQIHQLLLNLCVNARDAMGRGGRLTLGAFASDLSPAQAKLRLGANPGPYVVLSVADTGCGMGPQTLDRMFEPFFTTKESGKGTGLGLSTVHTIAKSHGGFVRCTSEVGRGTTFQVFLPTWATGAAAAAAPAAQAGPAAAVPASGQCLLVVDDEASVREMTRLTLETYGFQVVTAGDGRDAMARLAERPGQIAAVITDVMMPVMDGAGLIQELRRREPRPKIIAVSGIGNQQDGVLDADGFLAKPFSAEALLAALHQVLGQISA